MILENIKVSCNQTGKIIKASIDELSKETGEDLELTDIFDGNEVIYEAKDGKTYDVTIKNGLITGLFCMNFCSYTSTVIVLHLVLFWYTLTKTIKVLLVGHFTFSILKLKLILNLIGVSN